MCIWLLHPVSYDPKGLHNSKRQQIWNVDMVPMLAAFQQQPSEGTPDLGNCRHRW